MMKVTTILCLSAFLLLMAAPAGAQWYSIPYDWIELNPANPGAIPGTNSGITGDDQNLGPFNLGFTFHFYCNDFTSIRLCSNGFASFTSTSTDYSNNPIPDTPEPNNLVAPYWDDLNPSSYGFGSIWYHADPGGDFFVAQWDSVDHYGSAYTGDYFTFELILYPDNSIEYMYKAIVPGTVTPFPSATVGVEDAGGTTGAQATFDGSGPIEPMSSTGMRLDSTVCTTPVELSSFTAAIVNEGVKLSWNTASELDCYGWAVQRRQGEAEFAAVSPLIRGHGTTEEPQSYSFVDASAEFGETYNYRLKETDIGGAVTYSDPISITVDVATVTEYALMKSYPNPFNPTTTIGYALPEASHVTLTIYDVNGNTVAKLVDDWRDIGIHEAVFDGTKFASGVYIYHLTAGSFNASGKMVMMK